MSKWMIALCSGLAAALFGTFRYSFPAEWGGPGVLLCLIALGIAALAWTTHYLRGRNVG